MRELRILEPRKIEERGVFRHLHRSREARPRSLSIRTKHASAACRIPVKDRMSILKIPGTVQNAGLPPYNCKISGVRVKVRVFLDLRLDRIEFHLTPRQSCSSIAGHHASSPRRYVQNFPFLCPFRPRRIPLREGAPFAAAPFATPSPETRRIHRAMASTSSGSTNTPASPMTSGSEHKFDVRTGTPQAIASNGGRPKTLVQRREHKASAPRYTSDKSPSRTNQRRPHLRSAPAVRSLLIFVVWASGKTRRTSRRTLKSNRPPASGKILVRFAAAHIQ